MISADALPPSQPLRGRSVNLGTARRSRSLRALIATAVAGTLAGGALIAGASSAGADTPPPWVATEQTEHESSGTVSFYDATGNQVFGGALNSPLAAFAVASGGP